MSDTLYCCGQVRESYGGPGCCCPPRAPIEKIQRRCDTPEAREFWGVSEPYVDPLPEDIGPLDPPDLLVTDAERDAERAVVRFDPDDWRCVNDGLYLSDPGDVARRDRLQQAFRDLAERSSVLVSAGPLHPEECFCDGCLP